MAHKRARLNFVRERVENGTIEQWRRVPFTDESRMCLYQSDGSNKAYRRREERYLQCALVKTVSYGDGSGMIWAVISLETFIELFLVKRGMVNAHGFILSHDNARKHVVISVRQEWLEMQIPVMEWPARSSDLNPIERLWDQPKQMTAVNVLLAFSLRCSKNRSTKHHEF